MTLTLQFPPDIEAKLRERAAAVGKDVETLVREAVEAKLAGEPTAQPDLTPEEWVAQFDAWMKSRKMVYHPVDDSRESIYADRGE
jgi:plasmid stability protein